jgi:hypothetical protein
MEQQLTQQNETEKKGAVAKFIRAGILFIGVVVIVLTFVMAIYRKFGG